MLSVASLVIGCPRRERRDGWDSLNTQNLTEKGSHKGHPLYCGLTLERFTDRRKAARASAAGQLHTRDAAAAILGIRDADFAYLVRAGLLTHSDTARSH